MTSHDWSELDALFQEALDLPAEERPGFLDRNCPDPEKRARLERLLASAEGGDDLLATAGALDAAPELVEDALLEAAPPDSIPGYELQRPIGTGGMGAVWLAEQREPVQRRVAVKIIRPGMATNEVIARFTSERQTLARMNHPGIAQVYDAGVTDSGRPFFSMEYVDGPPLTAFCDEQRLSVRQRIELYVEICDAIQHAHQKGVIHRDLKPSNVLVTRVDGRPAPKVIDFGIARVIEGHVDGTLLTEANALIGTPEYMSPEQVHTEARSVDTRSDVYALGVLLYELLTGSLPFARSDSSAAGIWELFREVREEDPPLPSRYVSELADGGDSAAVARGTYGLALSRSLRGDLDWIVARALEKDPDRRYGSVGEFAEDLRRHLRDEPVEAGPPGTTYRVGKFVRRHRGLLAATAAILVALVAGLIGTWTGLLRAQHEAERARTQAAIAEAVNAFLNDDLLAAVSPGNEGRDVGMRDVLDAAAERLEGRFEDQPQVAASLHRTIGSTYMSLGLNTQASDHLEQAVAMNESALGEDDEATLRAVHLLGELRFYQGRIGAADTLLQRALDGRERVLGPNHQLTLAALNDLGTIAHIRGDLVAAEARYREAYRRGKEALGERDPYTVSATHNIGALLRDLARYDEAAEFLERAYELSREILGEEHPQTLISLSTLGSVKREQGKPDEAEPIYIQVYETRKRVLGEEHQGTLLSANNLATLYRSQKKFEEAEALQRETLATQSRTLGRDHDDSILSMGNLATILTEKDEFEEALALLTEAVDRCEATLGSANPLCASTLRKQGRVLVELGRYEDAEIALLAAHAYTVAAYDEEHESVGFVANVLVDLYEAWGRPAEAEEWRAGGPPAGS